MIKSHRVRSYFQVLSIITIPSLIEYSIEQSSFKYDIDLGIINNTQTSFPFF